MRTPTNRPSMRRLVFVTLIAVVLSGSTGSPVVAQACDPYDDASCGSVYDPSFDDGTGTDTYYGDPYDSDPYAGMTPGTTFDGSYSDPYYVDPYYGDPSMGDPFDPTHGGIPVGDTVPGNGALLVDSTQTPSTTWPSSSPGRAGTAVPLVSILLDRSEAPPIPSVTQASQDFRQLFAGRLVLALDAMAELGAFGRSADPAVNTRVRQAADLVPAGSIDAVGYRRELVALEADLPSMLDAARASGVEPGANLLALDAVLAPELLASLESGSTALVDPRPWYDAIADMLQRGGAAPIDGSTAQADEAVTLAFVQQFAEPVDPQTSAETAAAAPSVATSVPTTVAADDEPNGDVAPDSTSGASSLPLVGAVAAALVAVATAAALLRRRARTPLDPAPDLAGIRSDSTSATRITPDEPTDRSSGSLLGLLDASRRMTAALDPATVAAIACAEAVRMIDGEGAMLVRRDDGALRSSHCEPVSLFDTENLERSLLRRVVETGRSVASVASEEPALVDVPVSLTAVAVVADGIVIGALMVVRSASRPFDGADVESLETLAPLVGSALLAARAHGSATELADRDALTGLSNRRRLDRDLAALVSDGRSEVAAFVMVDVDHFKHFNDSNGHAAGDVALQTVARALTDSVRPGDRAYRYGGEEFCVLLPATTQADAELVAERMRRAVESAEIPGGEQQPGGRVTISVGVADSSGGGSSLVERADAALYEAKTAGRNRVCLAPID